MIIEIITNCIPTQSDFSLFQWLSNIRNFISSWASIIVIIYGFFKWNDIQKQKSIELYNVLYDSYENILEILNKKNSLNLMDIFQINFQLNFLKKNNLIVIRLLHKEIC